MNTARIALAAVLSLAAISCASMKSDSGMGQASVQLIKPEVTVVQLGGVPGAARHVDGGLPINYRIQVSNKAEETITLKNLTVVSMGRGAYEVPQTSRPFSLTVKPDQSGTADFWVPANTSSSILGANGPVTLRIVAHFDSAVGQFDEIVIQQVGGTSGHAASPQ
jgi:hypothetical protein